MTPSAALGQASETFRQRLFWSTISGVVGIAAKTQEELLARVPQSGNRHIWRYRARLILPSGLCNLSVPHKSQRTPSEATCIRELLLVIWPRPEFLYLFVLKFRQAGGFAALYVAGIWFHPDALFAPEGWPA